MPLLIDRQIAENVWVLVEPEEGQHLANLTESLSFVLLPFAALAQADAVDIDRLGVKINGDVDIERLAVWLPKLSLIAIDFPVFRDGRGFSLARQIRRLGYQGELRATGQFARDQLGYLARCGFNAFDFATEVPSDLLLGAFDEISVHYQGAADDPRPVYRQSQQLQVEA